MACLPRSAVCLALLSTATARADPAPDCHIGTYLLDGGSVVDVAPSDDGALRWRTLEGKTGALHSTPDGGWTSSLGWTQRPDGSSIRFSDCSRGEIDFTGRRGRRIAFDVKETTFESHGTRLVGRLVMPKGTGKVAVVVLLHGAEHDAALTDYFLQRLFPAEGIGAFVYDKRGTGQSGGAYSQDFNLLADDAVAAMREARRLSGQRLRRIGYQAGSQGGWVAPLAANRAPVDFVISCFGLAVSVIDEDQEEVEMEMREEGHSPEEIAKALEVARAAEAVFASGFTKGFEQLDGVRAKFKKERWYKDVHGNYTWFLLPHSEAELREMAPRYRWGTPFGYDPMPTLRANTTPQLWIVGGEDYQAPSAETSRRLQSLIAQGKPFTLAIYPKAEHGMTLFEKAPDGSRVSTSYAARYFEMMRDFARDGSLHGAYGDAQLLSPK
jgi:pimeloyl-ACP methyl ester carboxylesterase